MLRTWRSQSLETAKNNVANGIYASITAAGGALVGGIYTGMTSIKLVQPIKITSKVIAK